MSKFPLSPQEKAAAMSNEELVNALIHRVQISSSCKPEYDELLKRLEAGRPKRFHDVSDLYEDDKECT